MKQFKIKPLSEEDQENYEAWKDACAEDAMMWGDYCI